MKKPSVHILLEDLQRVVSDPLILSRIIQKAKDNPVRRSILTGTKTQKKHLKNSFIDNVELFNRLVCSQRSVPTRTVISGDKRYLMIADICKDAVEFVNHFELSTEEGFKEYVEIGLKKIGKNYRLNKFKTYKEYIFDTYERYQVIKSDDDKQVTADIANIYLEYAEINDDTQRQSIYKTYIHDFIYAKQQADENKANHRVWIKSQFDGLKYLEVVPNPYQLHGEEAQKRYLTNGKSTDSNWRVEALKRKSK